MKRTACIILALALLVLTAGCASFSKNKEVSRPEQESNASDKKAVPNVKSEPVKPDPVTPDGAVARVMEEIKALDADELSERISDGFDHSITIPPAFQDTLAQIIDRVEYQTGQVVQNGDKAEVQMEITSLDAGAAVNTAIGKVATKMLQQKIMGKEEPDITQIVTEVIDDIDISAMPGRTTQVTAHLVQEDDGEWAIDFANENNLEFVNAISGGGVDIALQLKKMAEDYGISLY